MKTLNKIIAVVIATASMGNAIALPDVSVINTRVGNILDKIGVDGAGYSAGDFTISGSNDLGTFSSDFTGADFSGASTAQDIATTLVGLNTDNTTVYVPGTVESVNDVRSDGLEDMLMKALAFKIDEITGDVGQLVSSFAIGKLAFETVLNNGDAIIAPSSVDYGHADAQSWFGVKNSLDIFTAASGAWVVGIQELNGDMDGDGARDTDRVSHFDAAIVVGAEVAAYDADQDVTSDVSLTRSTFDSNGVETLVTVNLGTSYDRDSLATASVALGSTTSSERIGILSGETIFSAARHANDTTGYAALILNSLDASALTTSTGSAGNSTVYTNDNGTRYVDNQDGTWSFYFAANTSDSVSDADATLTDAQVASSIAGSNWSDTGLFVTVTSTMNSTYFPVGTILKYNAVDSQWDNVTGSGSIGIDHIDSDGNLIAGTGSIIEGISSSTTSRLMYTTTTATFSTLVTTINSGALDMIENSEIKGYATELLTDTVDLTSPAWLQAL